MIIHPCLADALKVLGDRVLCSSSDPNWQNLRNRGITATDAAKLSSLSSVDSVLRSKFEKRKFLGNAYTKFGKTREPFIASWVQEEYNIFPCDMLVRSESEPLHLATPDSIGLINNYLVLAEIKTTSKPLDKIPINYLRQIWWQQYVCGAQATLFVWEEHSNFVPKYSTPKCVWVEKDEKEIKKLVSLAEIVLPRVKELLKQ